MPVSPHWFLDVRLEGLMHHGNSEVGFEMKSGIQLICHLGEFPGCGHTVCVHVCREWKFCQFEVSSWTNDKYHCWANSPVARLMSGAFRISQARCGLLGKMTIFINITLKILLWKRTGFGIFSRKHIKIRKMILKLWFCFWFWLVSYSFFPAILFLYFHVFALKRWGEGRGRGRALTTLRVKAIRFNFEIWDF